MTMKLYVSPVSPHSRKVMAFVSHLDLPVELIIPEPGELRKKPELLAVNPNGKVPTLLDDDLSLWESNSILRHLAEKAGSDMWPSDPNQQAEVIKWQFWEVSHYSPALLGVYFQRVIKPLFGIGDPDEAIIVENLEFTERFASVLDGKLRDNDFVTGPSPTIADFSIGVITESALISKTDLSRFDSLQAWLERMRSLKGWEEAVPVGETKMKIAA